MLRSFLLPLLGLLAVVQVPTAPVSQVKSSAPRPKVNPTPPLPPDSPVAPAVLAARTGEFEGAAQLLAALDPTTLGASEARRWRLSAVDAAVRTGNLPLLRRANEGGEGLLFAEGRQILHAWELAQIGQYAAARAVLKKLSDPEHLDERSRRRYLALLAGIAEREGNRKAERVYVAKLVDYVGLWKSETCQSCHERPETYGDDVTSLDVANHWIGKRFRAILAADGDTKRVQAEAQQRLRKDPEDEQARVRLAYALGAQGQSAQTERELRKLSWAAFSDRPFKQPDNDIVFPGKLPLEKNRNVEEFVPDNHVISASDYLRAAEFSRCRQELAALAPYMQLTVRQRYRVLAIEARLAQLEKNRGAERRALSALIALLQALPETPGSRFTPDNTWWVVRRLAALTQEPTDLSLSSLALGTTGLTINDLTRYP